MESPPQTTGEIPIAEISDEFRKCMLEFLLDRIRHQDDFPAFPESIRAVSRIAASDDKGIATLANLILKDFALTTKLLRMVNAAPFIQFGGGNISTITHAVTILGFDEVKNIAIALPLFDSLKNRKQASRLKNEFLRALFSGMLAREISHQAVARGTEEAFICGLLHNLGRLLAIQYFPDEDRETCRIMARLHFHENIASSHVLGFSYLELGMTVAREWRLPDQIIYSMGALLAEHVEYPESNHDKLLVLAVFSSEIGETIAQNPGEGQTDAIRSIIVRFADGLPLSENQLLDAIDKAKAELIQYANTIQINLQRLPFGRIIGQGENNATPGDGGESPATASNAENGCGSERDDEEDAALDILTAGIIDISEALVTETPLNHILHTILDTMHHGLDFRQVLLCNVDPFRNVMNASFGCGAEIEALIENFKFPLGGHADAASLDVFQAAVATREDILIGDIDHPDVCQRIPEWYRRATTARTFVLFPLAIRDATVAMIFADKTHTGTIRLGDSEKRLLRTLRNQAVLAIKQSL